MHHCLSLNEQLKSCWVADVIPAYVTYFKPQTADFGPKTALTIVDGLREGLKAGHIKTSEDMRAAIKQQVLDLLEPAAKASSSGKSSELQLQGNPAVLLIVGVNGAGKTTTIGKLAHRLSKEGVRVSSSYCLCISVKRELAPQLTPDALTVCHLGTHDAIPVRLLCCRCC
jgi:hypothetical protein